jgi:hypothetical protein
MVLEQVRWQYEEHKRYTNMIGGEVNFYPVTKLTLQVKEWKQKHLNRFPTK